MPSNSGWYQTGLAPLRTGATHEVQQRRVEGVDILTYESMSDTAVAVPDWQCGGSAMWMWGGSECSALDGGRVREGDEEEMGGHLGGQGFMRGGNEVYETASMRRERGGVRCAIPFVVVARLCR